MINILLLMINWWKRPVEIQRGMIYFVFSSLTPFLSFLYPFRTFTSFLYTAFLLHPFQNNSEIYQLCYVLRYFNVSTAHITSSFGTCLVVASLVK
jgi:hypothetical protein